MSDAIKATQTYLQETIEECIQSLLRLGVEIGGDGFEDVTEQEVLELLQNKNDALSIAELDEILTKTQADVEEINKENEELSFKLPSVTKIIILMNDVIEEALNNDPIMSRSQKFRHACEKAL